MDFKRIIQSGKFIPEIDGLRFIAIASVVLYHIYGFLHEKNKNIYLSGLDFIGIPNFVLNGSLGVELFFVISGFILGLFFAKAYTTGQKVNYLSYFKRRLTRLEPPYIIVMCSLFVVLVFVLKNLDLKEGIKSLICSITYSFNFFFGRGNLPSLNSVTWSLEVEVQFYILAPILGLLFKIKDGKIRRAIIISMAIIFAWIGSWNLLPFISLVDYVEYFLLGFLLVDFYIHKKEKMKSGYNTIYSIICIMCLYSFFQMKIPREYNNVALNFIYTLVQLVSLFVLFYLILFKEGLNVLKKRLITNIGGACYSIYLLHYPIISFFGNTLVRHKISQYQLIDNLIYTLILIFVIIFISAFFFLLIERPCMKSDWYKDILNKKYL